MAAAPVNSLVSAFASAFGGALGNNAPSSVSAAPVMGGNTFDAAPTPLVGQQMTFGSGPAMRTNAQLASQNVFTQTSGALSSGQTTKIGGSDSSYAGGITYTTPALQMGSYGGAAPNAGLSFDLPLSTINNMTNNALGFAQANNSQNQAFVGSVFNAAQGGVNTQAAASTNLFGNALSNQNALAMNNSQSLERMFQGFLGTTQYNADAGVRIAKANNKGGCFITTAICEAENKPDDCDELQTLRGFRDHYMMEGDGYALVQEYYAKAPAIVEAIKNRPDSAWCFEHLKTRYLLPAVNAVKAGDNEKALMLYTVLFVVAKSMTV